MRTPGVKVTRNVATQVKAPPLNNHHRLGLDLAEAKRLPKVIDGERLEALYALALARSEGLEPPTF